MYFSWEYKWNIQSDIGQYAENFEYGWITWLYIDPEAGSIADVLVAAPDLGGNTDEIQGSVSRFNKMDFWCFYWMWKMSWWS